MEKNNTFRHKLIQLSLKAAEESQGVTRDAFLAQAARLESTLNTTNKLPNKNIKSKKKAKKK